jgi:hypothetical protein
VAASTFLALFGVVNYARWGNPLIIADLSQQIYLVHSYPDRLERLETYGLFHWSRVAYCLTYYFFPIWILWDGTAYMLQGRMTDLFDSVELPPASFFLTDPLGLLLAWAAAASLWRGMDAFSLRGSLAVLAGLAIPPALFLSGWYLAFRYRAEFAPLILVSSCLGARAWCASARGWTEAMLRRRIRTISLLFLVQIVMAQIFAALYAVSGYGASYAQLSEGLLNFYLRQAGVLVRLF